MKRRGFTVTEAMLVLLFLGFIAALSIPVIISVQKYIGIRPSYRKAVIALDDAIQVNITKGERSPYLASDLSEYLRKPLEILSHNDEYTWADGNKYSTFVTSDKTRYLIGDEIEVGGYTLKSHNCGGGNISSTGTTPETASPCIIIADVNGDKKPNTLTTGDDMLDAFFILITNEGARPFGTVANAIFYGNRGR